MTVKSKSINKTRKYHLAFCCVLSCLLSWGAAHAGQVGNGTGMQNTVTMESGRIERIEMKNIVIAAVGDIMMGTTYPKPLLPPHDGQGMFDGAKDPLSGADIVMGNLEGPLLDEGTTTKCKDPESPTCYAFKTPERYAKYLKDAGFNALGVANNHASDFGIQGVERTISLLKENGIGPVGGRAEADFVIDGKVVKVIGFSFLTSTPYSHDINDIDSARAVIREAKSRCDILIVSFHGGAEGKSARHVNEGMEKFLEEERGDVIGFSRSAVDEGADLVIGHGPHVLRAMEVYRGRLIAYSLGNFLTYGRFNTDGYSGITAALRIEIDLLSGEFSTGRIISMKLSGEGIPSIDESNAAVAAVRELTSSDLKDASGIVIDDSGVISAAK